MLTAVGKTHVIAKEKDFLIQVEKKESWIIRMYKPTGNPVCLVLLTTEPACQHNRQLVLWLQRNNPPCSDTVQLVRNIRKTMEECS